MLKFLDYSTFCDMSMLSSGKYRDVEDDFCSLMRDDLALDFKVDFAFSINIPKIVFNTMITGPVYYHTPFHPLAMFEFAKIHNITLTPVQKLAIWFHDSIFIPGYPKNEVKSALFLDSLMSPCLSEIEVNAAKKIVVDTAYHLEDPDYTDKESHLVMDLDMAGFAAGIKGFRVQNECIEKEFKSIGFDDDKFLSGRINFLEAILDKNRIYHTDYFYENFETIARQNIKNLITETKLRQENKE